MQRKLRILILDDEKIVCDRLRAALERLGFHVEAYTDSRAAIARVAAERFDVVVTDLKMPAPAGIDVLAFVREQSPSTKVVVITGFATVETTREVLKKGAVDLIPKPFKLSQLRDLIVRIAAERPGRTEDMQSEPDDSG